MNAVRKFARGRGVDGEYLSPQWMRDQAFEKRQANKAAGLCVNETKYGTHGFATEGVRCKGCADARRRTA